MSLVKRWRSAGERADSFLGRIVYRFFGLIALLVAVVALWAAWDLISNGKSVSGGLFLALPGGLCLWLARWCFSPERKLSEMEL